MLRSLNYLIILTGLSILLSACGDDAFSQISKIEVPEHTPLTAMSLAIVNGDTVLYPYIGQSRGITEDEVRNGPEGTLTLAQNGTVISTTTVATGTQVQGAEGYRLDTNEPVNAQAGDVFQLEGTVEGLEMATSNQVMPAAAQVELVSYTPEGGISSDGDRVDELIFDIIDPEATTDYYAFEIGYRAVSGLNCPVDDPNPEPVCDTTFSFRSFFTESIDPLTINTYDFNLVLEDGVFNGDNYRLRVLFYNNLGEQSDEPLFLRAYTLTEDGLRYIRSRTAFEDARFDPFSEPVNVHDNIDNGYGFFMVTNLTQIQIN